MIPIVYVSSYIPWITTPHVHNPQNNHNQASKHDTSSQCLTNVGPPSTTLVQHWSKTGQMCHVCWEARATTPRNRHPERDELYEPSRCIKATFRIADKWPKFSKISSFRTISFMELVKIALFFTFVAHFKSSSFTASRELRQQFAACSEWRWQW